VSEREERRTGLSIERPTPILLLFSPLSSCASVRSALCPCFANRPSVANPESGSKPPSLTVVRPNGQISKAEEPRLTRQRQETGTHGLQCMPGLHSPGYQGPARAAPSPKAKKAKASCNLQCHVAATLICPTPSALQMRRRHAGSDPEVIVIAWRRPPCWRFPLPSLVQISAPRRLQPAAAVGQRPAFDASLVVILHLSRGSVAVGAGELTGGALVVGSALTPVRITRHSLAVAPLPSAPKDMAFARLISPI